MSKRLQKELKEFMDAPQGWFKAELASDDNLFLWRVAIDGPEKTPFEKGTFKIEIEVPTDYPFKPPKVKFLTKIYHPNVKSDGGFCTDMLTTEGWSPQLKIQQVIDEIYRLMKEPNADNPLEPEIAQQFKTDKTAWAKTAKEWTKKHAK
ncbi:ubiquitin-conjugating enzyme E2 [Planoprotostelium fungivorum]|uniref:E2 ubiquitin-conjugating enzyme n=1 Tax=Planoprotostelium fungivorum TaxID=1890364 RepID=A0A2P6N723_9EUKA|nr:ubiquitin-conjugating enzyme E2 [Planoprotostelium fungivorum]PRP79740.1 ubiquitin-conjugating enzyme E2 [Planoprotostelium fungivorum]